MSPRASNNGSSLTKDLDMEVARIYDADAAEVYDDFELSDGWVLPVNGFVSEALRRIGSVRDVLDMTCGTGAQAIALAAAGFKVTASDLSAPMLHVAKRKIASAGLKVDLHQADMRDVSLGSFDAIVSMYNAIGHLSPEDFSKTCINAASNLRPGGVYIFDIFDRGKMHLLPKEEILDLALGVRGTRRARFTVTRFDEALGLLRVDQRTYSQSDVEPIRVMRHEFTLQTYHRGDLVRIALDAGFIDLELLRTNEVVTGRLAEVMHLGVARVRR